MAGEMDLFQVSTSQLQNIGNGILWVGLGLFFAALVGVVVYQLIRLSKYNMSCIIYDQIGDKQLIIPDKVKVVRIEGSVFYHFLKTNIFSPKFDVKYMSFFKQAGFLGFGSKTKLGFVIYKYGEKITPVELTGNYGIKPIDYDAWNYLVQRFKANHAKYERNQELMRMLPIIGLGLVVIAFIMTNLLWGQHIEKMATLILNSANSVARQMLENSGAIQILGN